MYFFNLLSKELSKIPDEFLSGKVSLLLHALSKESTTSQENHLAVACCMIPWLKAASHECD